MEWPAMRSKWKGTVKRHPVLAVVVVFMGIAVLATGCRLFLKGGVAFLTVTPDRIEQCTSPNVAVEVRWYAPRMPLVNIYTSKLGEPPQLWLTAGGRGTIRTGTWIADGSTVLITDAQGRTLARRTVTSVDCGPDAPHPKVFAGVSEP
jgi:hypothetical protein